MMLLLLPKTDTIHRYHARRFQPRSNYASPDFIHSPAIARVSTVATEQEHAAFHGAASLWCFVMVSDEFSSEANQFSPQLRG